MDVPISKDIPFPRDTVRGTRHQPMEIIENEPEDNPLLPLVPFDKLDTLPGRTGYLIDDDAKRMFLCHYAHYGRFFQAAQLIGTSHKQMREHEKSDPAFAAAVKEAVLQYRDRIQQAVYEQAVEGIPEPIMGGKNRDEIVATRRVYATNLLAMEAKRVNPDYREKQQLDVQVRGGVLIAPAGLTSEEWAQRFTATPDPNMLPEQQEP